jgi:hypothetical protein
MIPTLELFGRTVHGGTFLFSRIGALPSSVRLLTSRFSFQSCFRHRRVLLQFTMVKILPVPVGWQSLNRVGMEMGQV